MVSVKRNAIILAAGTSSRFIPLSAERPKGLLEVKGEILVERQIRQLQEAGVADITIVVGYKAEMFDYLRDKYGVDIVVNEDYARYNNISSIVRVLDHLGNTYICSSDNYFPENVFMDCPGTSYYSALYADGPTGEYCLAVDDGDNITGVKVGGADSWYMVGHVYFSEEFSRKFSTLVKAEYDDEGTRNGYWEDLYIKHLSALPPMRIRRYSPHEIEEFDSLDELRMFDRSYIEDTRSDILKQIASDMQCRESELSGFRKVLNEGDHLMFDFDKGGSSYRYDGRLKSVTTL